MRRSRLSRDEYRPLMQDIAIIALSVVVAIMLVRTGTLTNLIVTSHVGYEFLESFIAGIFFTSVFTTVPAIVALGKIAQIHGVLETAFWGSIGSVVGDLLIFSFVKDRLSEHIMTLLSHQGMGRRMRALFRLRMFRRLSFLVGGIIIASPLPDEIGIALMGFSKMRTLYFIPLTFVFNFIGLLFIGYIATS